MPKLRRNGFRFQVLRTISETGPIDEFALAEEMCLRSQKQLPIRVRLMLRVLFELEAKGWIQRTIFMIPGTSTWVSMFSITKAGELALPPPAKNFREVLARCWQRLRRKH